MKNTDNWRHCRVKSEFCMITRSFDGGSIWLPKAQVVWHEGSLGFQSNNQTKSKEIKDQLIDHQSICKTAASLHHHSFSFYALLDMLMVPEHTCICQVEIWIQVYLYNRNHKLEHVPQVNISLSKVSRYWPLNSNLWIFYI